jgi:hypothetical protein
VPSSASKAAHIGQTEEAVAAFFGSFFISIGILLVFSIPTFYLAWRKGRNKTIRRFLITAGATALFTAAISASSGRLVDQCRAAGNFDCVDYGSSGLQLLFIVGYIIVSVVKAVLLFRE